MLQSIQRDNHGSLRLLQGQLGMMRLRGAKGRTENGSHDYIRMTGKGTGLTLTAFSEFIKHCDNLAKELPEMLESVCFLTGEISNS